MWHDLKYLPFREAMLALVRTGTKTVTSRTKRYGSPGDRLAVGEPGETVTLIEVERLTLECVAAWRYSEEGFASPDEFKRAWCEIHPRKGWVPEQLVWVHEFRYEKKEAK